MGIADDILSHPSAALAALAYQLDLGADETIGDTPIDRFAEAAKPAPVAMTARGLAPTPASRPGRTDADASPDPGPDPGPDPRVDPVAVARAMAEAAADLDGLRLAIQGYDLCDLKKGARNTVFADGNPGARVMIVGEAPGREEDLEGLPFVGRAGQLLDRMFAAIGLSRRSPDAQSALYITNVMPWRPPQNREPDAGEIAMMRPFLERHIELVDPVLIVVMGNTPCQALLNQKGILRLRGHWMQGLGRPVMPMTHPAYLLRTPGAKREAWADLQQIEARLKENEKV